jgi:hypothetical protein
MKETICKLVLNYPKIIILLSVILTIGLTIGIRDIRIEDDIKKMYPEEMPVRQSLNQLEDIFGGSEIILITLSNEKEGIFNRKTLKKIKDLTASLEDISGIRKVTSLATLNQIKGREWGLEVIPYLEEVPETKEGLKSLQKRIMKDEEIAGLIVSKDGKHTSILVQIEKNADSYKLHEELKSLIDRIGE